MNVLKKYAELLTTYCLELQPGDRCYIQSSTLAEPLVREVYRSAVSIGAFPEVDLIFKGKNRIFYEEANQDQLTHISPLTKNIIETFDAYLNIRAPFNLKEDHNIDGAKRKIRSESSMPLNEIFSQRTASGSLKRSLCQYPTDASAQEANMSLEEYEQFVFGACHLYDEDPASSWQGIRARQQGIVDFLNGKENIKYKNEKTDITFSVRERNWINSDGRVNMPSGEVFTGPVESSVEGVVYFDYPSIFMGKEVSGVTFEVKNGRIEQWSAEKGQDILDEVMNIKGTRYFGEAAIGTNYNISKPTKNILFDEKIGGTIHMAVGQSYIQTGGQNKSTVHWDLIADMRQGGEIYADDELIYEDGKFLI